MINNLQNNSLVLGHLKELLSSINLPLAKVYTEDTRLYEDRVYLNGNKLCKCKNGTLYEVGEYSGKFIPNITRKFNIKDICRFFGVPPTKVFDFSDASYNTLEATQLQFLTDCLAPLLEKIESEFERKLFKPNEKFKIDVRFDTSAMLRTDKQAEADYINKLFYMGAISVNEIRKKLDLSPIENGDTHLVQSNLMTLDNAIKVVPKTDKATTEIDDNSNN